MFGLFAIFQDELEARISLKAFFLQLKGQLNILQNVFFLSELRSEGLFKCCTMSDHCLKTYKYCVKMTAR